MPSSTPATMKPIPANSCSRPSMAWRSSGDACPRLDDVAAAVGTVLADAVLAGGRFAVVVVFDRFLGWPHVVIEIPTVPRGCCRDGASRRRCSAGIDRLDGAIRADDDHQLASLAGGRRDAVLNGAVLASLDEEQIEARFRKLGPHLREDGILVEVECGGDKRVPRRRRRFGRGELTVEV